MIKRDSAQGSSVMEQEESVKWTARVDVSPEWISRYPYRCASCSEYGREGDTARFVEGQVMHNECALGAMLRPAPLMWLDREEVINLVSRVLAWSEDPAEVEALAKDVGTQDLAQQCCEDLGLLT